MVSRLTFFFFLNLLLVGKTLPAFAADSLKAQALFDQAMQSRNAGSWDESDELLKEAVTLDPNQYQYHFELGNSYAFHLDDARQHNDSMTAENALLQAIHEFEKTALLRPDYVPAYYNLGILQKNTGAFEKSRDAFKHVIQIDPHQIKAYVQIGEIYERQGFFDDARDYYQKAKEIEPMNADVNDAIQMSYQNEGRYDQQIKSRNRMGSLSQMSDMLGSRSALDAPLNASGPQNGTQTSGSSTPAMSQLGMMLAQHLLTAKKSNE